MTNNLPDYSTSLSASETDLSTNDLDLNFETEEVSEEPRSVTDNSLDCGNPPIPLEIIKSGKKDTRHATT